MFIRKITKNGNTRTVSIPISMLNLLDIKIGDSVQVVFDSNRIIIQKESEINGMVLRGNIKTRKK